MGECIKQRLLDNTCEDDEDDEGAEESTELLPLTTPPASPPSAPAPAADPPSAPANSLARSKLKSRARRDRKREAARAALDNPLLKSVHRKRVAAAKSAALELDVDAAQLKHAKRAWQGSGSKLNDDYSEFCEPPSSHDLETGLGGVLYTQDEVDALTGTRGFMYIPWLGR